MKCTISTAGSLWHFLRSYTPDIEQVSVDECYMDFTGISGRFASPVEAAFEIKDEVKKTVWIHS